MIAALIPIALACLAALAVALLHLTERSAIGTPVEDFFYGFFLRSYPLFLFCMVYGAARIVVAAFAVPGRRRWLRLAAAPLGLALFLAAGFHPTFGGFILRPGFAVGGLSFLNNVPGPLAAALGAAVAAIVYAVALGLATALATLRFAIGRRPALRALARTLALIAGAIVLALASGAVLGGASPFPLRPLSLGQGLAVALLLVVALSPHAILSVRPGA